MGAFLDYQAALAEELSKRGISRAVWEWNALGWSQSSPNSGRRWRCKAAGIEGAGDTGEEALRNLVEALQDGNK